MIKAVINFQDGTVGIKSSNVEKVSDSFDAGFYSCIMTREGPVINKEVIEDIQKPLPCKEFVDIYKYCRKFYNQDLRKKVNKLGFKHKLGILLYGIQGTGKTTFLLHLSKTLVEERGAVVMIARNSDELMGAIFLCKQIRKIQPDVPLVIIGDEFERWAEGAEAEMKSLLDGVDSIENLLFLAATNYIEKIPDSLKNRPSRFKAVVEIDKITDKDVIYNVLKSKSDILSLYSEEELVSHAESMAEEGITLDEVKNFILDEILQETLQISTKRPKIKFGNKEESEDEVSPPIISWSLEEVAAKQKPPF